MNFPFAPSIRLRHNKDVARALRSLSVATLLVSSLTIAGCVGDDTGGTPEPQTGVEPGTTPDAGEPGGGPGVAPVTGVAPVLSVVTANQVGARGQTLQITVEGGDVDGDATGVVVELLDASGAPIPLFDRDGDGEPDDAKRRLLLDPSPLGEETFVADASMLSILDDVDNATSVRVTLIDAEGSTSEVMESPIQLQSEVATGESCDPTYLLTRCAYGFGCQGEPATCQEGTAPQIERLAYQRTDEGTEILIDGVEAEDDLKAIFLEFLDRNGDPVEVDLDSDGTPESISFNVEVVGEAINGRFLVRLVQSEGFAEGIDRIAATGVDDNGHTGERVIARLRLAPVRGFNQSCDPFGFDKCTSGAACSPNSNGIGHRCRVVGPMQSALCEAAPVVEPGETIVVTAAGGAFGASLWDPPLDCAPNNPIGHPEGAVVLHLSEPAAGLRIRTDYDGTDFDTIVYVVEGCPRDVTSSLGCDDDSGSGVFSDLDLNFVPAGDYLIVVDSYDREGGNFVLTVEVE